MSDNGKPVKVVKMETSIPDDEEPVATIQIVAGKSGAIYVGHAPGTEAHAFQLCLGGANAIMQVTGQRLAAMLKEKNLIRVAGSLESFGLGRGATNN